MRQRWIEATNGQVVLTIYTDGVMGGEAEVVRRMRIGQLQAGMLTVVGLSEIDRSVTALQYMPMMFRSLAEVDFVREKLREQLEKRLLDKGFVALFWGDAGWIRFFSRETALHPADFKRLKLFAWTGDEPQIAPGFTRAHSSAGQSDRLITGWSQVRILVGPFHRWAARKRVG